MRYNTILLYIYTFGSFVDGQTDISISYYDVSDCDVEFFSVDFKWRLMIILKYKRYLYYYYTPEARKSKSIAFFACPYSVHRRRRLPIWKFFRVLFTASTGFFPLVCIHCLTIVLLLELPLTNRFQNTRWSPNGVHLLFSKSKCSQ